MTTIFGNIIAFLLPLWIIYIFLRMIFGSNGNDAATGSSFNILGTVQMLGDWIGKTIVFFCKGIFHLLKYSIYAIVFLWNGIFRS